MGLKFFLEELFKMPVDLHSKASCPERFFKRIQAELKHVA
jgi:predicted nucleotidyltransferase